MVRTRILTEKERLILNQHLKNINDPIHGWLTKEDWAYFKIILSRIRKLELSGIEGDLELITQFKNEPLQF